jgi:hypothetical protein
MHARSALEQNSLLNFSNIQTFLLCRFRRQERSKRAARAAGPHGLERLERAENTCHGGRCAPRAPPRTPHAARKRGRRSVSGPATAAAPRPRSRVAPAQSVAQWQQCTRRTAAAGRCDLSRGPVAGGGRGLREPGVRKLRMRPREGLVARNVMARSTEARLSGGRRRVGQCQAHLQLVIKKWARARAVGRHAGAGRGLW